MMNNEDEYMAIALEEARKAADRGEVPIGAVLVDTTSQAVIAKNGNRTRELNDPSAHAEMLVIRQGCEIKGAQRIPECDLYVTLEPCNMCAGAISFARIRKLVFAASDEKGGAVINGTKFYSQATCHHKPQISHGVLSEDCSKILKEFFIDKR